MNSELEARIQRRERIFLSILTGAFACHDAPDNTPETMVNFARASADEALRVLEGADAELRADALLDPGISDSADAQRYRKLEAAVKSLAIGDTLSIFDYAGEIRIVDGDDHTLSEGDTLGEAIDSLPMP